jgi:hypothetical protein
MKNQSFIWEPTNVFENTTINVEDGGECADMFFYNNPGSAPVTIGGSYVLDPGNTLSLPAFGRERQTGIYTISFAGGSGHLVISRKRYR